jgi:hypothetical protein
MYPNVYQFFINLSKNTIKTKKSTSKVPAKTRRPTD